MVSVLDRKLLREVRSSVALLLAITSIIAVGSMCFVYMRSAYHNLNLAKFRYYAQCRMADFWVEVKKAPLVELEALSKVPGVTAIRPRIQFYATVDLDRSPAPLNGMVLSLPDDRESDRVAARRFAARARRAALSNPKPGRSLCGAKEAMAKIAGGIWLAR